MDLKTEIINSQRNTSAESGGDVEQKRDKFKSGKGLDLLGCFLNVLISPCTLYIGYKENLILIHTNLS